MTKAVLFDCFGVLYSDRLLALFATHTHDDPRTFQAFQMLCRSADTGHLAATDFWQGLADLMGLSVESCRHMVDAERRPNELLWGNIARWKSAYKIGLISNAGQDIWEYITPVYQRLFDASIVSYQVGVTKPDPAIFTYACTALGVAPQEVLFVDDSEANCAAARALGMKVVRYDGPGAMPEIEHLL